MAVPDERRGPWGPASLLARTNVILAVGSLVIALIAIAALNVFVIEPIADRPADDETAVT